ncbi:hypothetical protein [Mycolicibacterium sp. F2034L]|uniref:hypothetical protein n=1 Tax=Mycolicibacterium sp. F2034L TaxID=2926422 RepID=UPI001FF5B6D5|nr:hypothetical protein [Mycolicibacterium sp. F2034L]MCK0174779.1 hypothetical protein [Mycolicibacterium sp. F2034L]
MSTARGVDLEIVEQKLRTEPLVDGLNVIVPNDVRINGLPVLVPSDTTIEIEASDTGGVTARLSVFVGRLTVHPERPAVDDGDPPIYAQLLLELAESHQP